MTTNERFRSGARGGVLALGACATVCGCDRAKEPTANADAPIACDLTVFDDAERAAHAALTRRLFATVTGIDERRDGYAFSFAPGRADDVARWVEEESRCCPFFAFETGCAPDGTVRLTISGPPAAKEILRAGIAAYRPS